MKIKAVEIAKKLNISKATVSLALNNRPGVSEKTREMVLRCAKELEEITCTPDLHEKISKKMIKVILVDKHRGNIRDTEMDLGADVFALFDQEFKKLGYTQGIVYIEMVVEEIQQVIEEVNSEEVAGAILMATEMDPEDMELFKQIKKPLIIYDNDLSDEYHCVIINNVSAVKKAVDLLVERGCKEIVYLSNATDIYNFKERRAGFRAGLRKHGLELKENSIVPIGNLINDSYKNAKEYLETHTLPDAFIMENYQVSLGMVRALRDKEIKVPKEISLIAIDEFPNYLLPDVHITTVKIEHRERAKAVTIFLEQEIKGYVPNKFKIYSNCNLVLGNSVK